MGDQKTVRELDHVLDRSSRLKMDMETSVPLLHALVADVSTLGEVVVRRSITQLTVVDFLQRRCSESLSRMALKQSDTDSVSESLNVRQPLMITSGYSCTTNHCAS